jgi:hypothetical protein
VKLLKKGMMKLSGKNIFLPQNIPGDYELLFPNERTNSRVFIMSSWDLTGLQWALKQRASFFFFFLRISSTLSEKTIQL